MGVTCVAGDTGAELDARLVPVGLLFKDSTDAELWVGWLWLLLEVRRRANQGARGGANDLCNSVGGLDPVKVVVVGKAPGLGSGKAGREEVGLVLLLRCDLAEAEAAG